MRRSAKEGETVGCCAEKGVGCAKFEAHLLRYEVGEVDAVLSTLFPPWLRGSDYAYDVFKELEEGLEADVV